jgi:diamine N-acetyltransferase
MKIRIKKCTINDLSLLKEIGYETYDNTFRSMNTKDTIESYLSSAFNYEKLSEELMTSGSKFYFIYADDNLAGYLKINDVPVQSDINDPKSIEIERIYVKKVFKGLGIGKQLINYVTNIAKEIGKEYIWLGVWEKNKDAISFYTKMGFKIAGKHSFKMGKELQSDLIMKKNILK